MTVKSRQDRAEFLADTLFDHAFDHHGGQWQVEVEVRHGVFHGQSAGDLGTQRLETKGQGVILPLLVQVGD